MKITNVELLGDMRVRLRFADNYTSEIDLSPLPKLYPIFKRVLEPEVFKRVRVDCDTIAWDHLDLCPDVVRTWCEAGEVLSREETSGRIARVLNSAPELVGAPGRS
jgi:hypothetical protein